MKKTPREIMILVVESFPGMALLWERRLGNLWGNDVRIISAESESETLKILRRMPAIDIIITNAVLGQYPLGSKRRADAIPLVKKIRETYPNTPMVAMSTNPEFRDKMMKAGCNHQCNKTWEDLRQKMKELIEMIQ